MHLQDAPDLIEKVLNSEQDLSTKRNAFLMLCNHAQDRAVHYLLSQVDNVAHWGDILQMAVLELIRKVCLDLTKRMCVPVTQRMHLLPSLWHIIAAYVCFILGIIPLSQHQADVACSVIHLHPVCERPKLQGFRESSVS